MIEIRYVLKNKTTQNIEIKTYNIESIERGLHDLFDVDNYEIVSRDRFTGLLDKNGKKIFEGDVLKVGTKHGFHSDLLHEFKEKNNLESLNDIGLHFTGIVRLDFLRGLMFENCENGYQEPMFSRHINIVTLHSDIEIIGNIHDNPNLLEP